jgi:hypothetical protein
METRTAEAGALRSRSQVIAATTLWRLRTSVNLLEK